MNHSTQFAPPPAWQEQFRIQVEAEIVKRKREGTWQGAVIPDAAYQTRPLEWIVERLGVPEQTLRWSMNQAYQTCWCAKCVEAKNAGQPHLWDGDVDPLLRILEALRDWKSVGVESATGCGKTFLAACITLWFLACFEDSLVIQVAPKEDQLLLQVWKEIGMLAPKFKVLFPDAQFLEGKIRMKPDVEGKEKWAAFAFVCGVGANEEAAGRAKGFHAQHMLIITEETQKIDASIMASLAHTRTADHNLQLALGNPEHRFDQLHQFCEKKSVVHIRISSYDHPNIVTGDEIVPGALGRIRLAEREEEYAPPTSRLFLSQIRGISPSQSNEALIRWEWLEAAAKRMDDPIYRVGELALGVDFANSEHGDLGAISRWQGSACTEVVAFPCPDATLLGEDVVREAKDAEHPVDPRYIGIDSAGMGGPVFELMKRRGLKVRAINGAAKAVPGIDKDILWSEVEADRGHVKPVGPKIVESSRFDNLRSQAYWRAREDLRLGRIAVAYDRKLFEELTSILFDGTSIIAVEDKKSVFKRIRRSPDRADAFVYGNFVRRRQIVTTKDSEDAAPATDPRSARNFDRGLEKLLARHDKQTKAADRQLQRALGRRARMRRKGF